MVSCLLPLELGVIPNCTVGVIHILILTWSGLVIIFLSLFLNFNLLSSRPRLILFIFFAQLFWLMVHVVPELAAAPRPTTFRQPTIVTLKIGRILTVFHFWVDLFCHLVFIDISIVKRLLFLTIWCLIVRSLETLWLAPYVVVWRFWGGLNEVVHFLINFNKYIVNDSNLGSIYTHNLVILF